MTSTNLWKNQKHGFSPCLQYTDVQFRHNTSKTCTVYNKTKAMRQSRNIKVLILFWQSTYVESRFTHLNIQHTTSEPNEDDQGYDHGEDTSSCHGLDMMIPLQECSSNMRSFTLSSYRWCIKPLVAFLFSDLIMPKYKLYIWIAQVWIL
jgi:hypothetical protein